MNMESLSEQQRVQVMQTAQSGLEIVLHSLLYKSGLYPKSGYMATRYGGIRCWVHRMPAIVSYIGETLQTAVPALFSQTNMNHHNNTLSLVLLDSPPSSDEDNNPILSFPPDNTNHGDEDSVVPLEEYALELSTIIDRTNQNDSESSGSSKEHPPKTKEEVDQMLRHLEKQMRDMILRIMAKLHSAPSNKRMWSPHAHFKITLTLSSPDRKAIANNANATKNDAGLLESLDQSLQDGTWITSAPTIQVDSMDSQSIIMEEQPPKLVRPLISIRIPSCGFRMQLLSFIPPRENH